MLLLAICSQALVQSQGYPSRFDFDIEGIEADLKYTGDEFDTSRSPSSPLTTKLGVPSEGGLDFILWGDSHARCYAHGFDQVARELGLRGESIAIRSAAPILGAAQRFDGDSLRQRQEQIHRHLLSARPARVILASRWNAYLNGPNAVESDSPADTYWLAVERQMTPTAMTSFIAMKQGLLEVQETCRSIGATLVILRQVPDMPLIDPARTALDHRMGRIRELPAISVTEEAVQQDRMLFNEVLDALDSSMVEVLDPMPVLADSLGRVSPFQAGRSLYRDNDHLSRSGVEAIRPVIESALGRR